MNYNMLGPFENRKISQTFMVSNRRRTRVFSQHDLQFFPYSCRQPKFNNSECVFFNRKTALIRVVFVWRGTVNRYISRRYISHFLTYSDVLYMRFRAFYVSYEWHTTYICTRRVQHRQPKRIGVWLVVIIFLSDKINHPFRDVSNYSECSVMFGFDLKKYLIRSVCWQGF